MLRIASRGELLNGSTKLIAPQNVHRYLKKGKAPKKPRMGIYIDEDGKVPIPRKVPGLNQDQNEHFQKWLKRLIRANTENQSNASNEEFKSSINREIKLYFETLFGVKRSLFRREANRKRLLRKKRRHDILYRKKVANWNKYEDFKEDRVIRDRARALREEKKEQFSFSKFLKTDREKKRGPLDVESEEEFIEKLEQDMSTYLVKGPKSSRWMNRSLKSLGYKKRLLREIVDPWIYELRRKGRVAEIVDAREEKIAILKLRRMIAERKAKRLETKKIEFAKKQEHWDKVLGTWHQYNNDLKKARDELTHFRTEMRSHARSEFLAALSEHLKDFSETPNECRFNRFRLIEGVKFPFNKSNYI